MLKHRLITGPLLILALLGIVILDNWLDSVPLSPFWQSLFVGKTTPPRGLVLFGLGLLVAPLAANELSRIFQAVGIRTKPWLTTIAAMLGMTLSYSVPMQTQAIPAIAIVSSGIILVFVASLLIFSQDRNVEGLVAAAGAVMFAMVYLGLMLGFLLALRRNYDAWIIVGVILTTKSCDTGAYFTGRAIGRHKLIPWLSPGKTWEGLAGGIVLAVVTGLLGAWASQQWLDPTDHVPLLLGASCGLVFAIVGQCGDLVMSLFKRSAGLKDSSSILPGLGGVLDVLDSPLLVAPVAFWMFTMAP